jgi:hypothetical protein
VRRRADAFAVVHILFCESLICSQNTVQLETAGMAHVAPYVLAHHGFHPGHELRVVERGGGRQVGLSLTHSWVSEFTCQRVFEDWGACVFFFFERCWSIQSPRRLYRRRHPHLPLSHHLPLLLSFATHTPPQRTHAQPPSPQQVPRAPRRWTITTLHKCASN